jgi:hypothetical protein
VGGLKLRRLVGGGGDEDGERDCRLEFLLSG